MGAAIGQALPLAVGVALSPIPIIAVVLMLMSARARLNGPGSVLGLLLIGVAVRQWRGRPKPGQDVEAPKWMGSIERFNPPRAAGAGAVLSGLNPKNTLLAVGAATGIAQSGIGAADQAVAYAVFAVVATLGVAAPVVMYFALGERSRQILTGLRDWMGQHNAAIMAVLCLVIGAKLIGDAISGFTA